MIKNILIVVVILVVGVLAFAATKPDTFRVQRATSIKAPPEKFLRSSTTSSAGTRGRRGRKKIPR